MISKVIHTKKTEAGHAMLRSTGCCGDELYEVLSTQKDGVLRISGRYPSYEDAMVMYNFVSEKL